MYRCYLLAISIQLTACLFGQLPDIVLHNAHVITLDNGAIQQALSISEGKILDVGTDADILSTAGVAKTVDLGGRTVLPAFVEGHSHIIINRPEDMGLAEVSKLIASYGYSSVTEMVGYKWFVEELQDAAMTGELDVRVNVFPNYNYGHLIDGKTMVLEEFYPDHNPILDPGLLVRVPGIKIFMDGTSSRTRGCWAVSTPFREEFLKDSSFIETGCEPLGTMYLDPGEVKQIVKRIQDRGFRAAFHSFGDSAITVTLDAIESALGGLSNDEIRHTIHHNGLVRDDQLLRYQQLGIIASVRGMFQTCIQSVYSDFWFTDQQMPWLVNRYQIPAITHAFIEGDFGWTRDPETKFASRQINPWLNIWAIVTHQQINTDGKICAPAPWLDRHQVSLQRALEMYTLEPAYAVSMEDHLGSITPGKFADLIVVSDDPFSISEEDIKDIQVLWTLRNGQTIYCREDSDLNCEALVSAACSSSQRLKCYPNPTSHLLRLFDLPAGRMDVRIIDLIGREWLDSSIRGPTVDIDVSTYPEGVFIILLSDDNQHISRRFIRVH